MPIQNKVGAFLANPILYRILAEPEKTLNFRRITTDLLNLPNYHIYLKLMIDGAPSKAFSGVTMRPGERTTSPRPRLASVPALSS
jgi:hypothetical protein